jgi:hypothetical protein
MFWLNWSGYPGCLKVTVCSGRPPPKLLSGRAGCAGTGCLKMIWADGVLKMVLYSSSIDMLHR